MRLIATADLHYNHPKSRALADDLIDQVNRAGGDILLLVGDTAVADGDSLEQCLSRFRFVGPKLFVPGNHELWTHGPDGQPLKELPPRAAEHLLPQLISLRDRADYQGQRAWTLFRVRAASASHRVVWADLGRLLAAVALTGTRDADRLPLNSCYVAPTSTAAEAAWAGRER